ncbi:MAG: hypothetical protein A2135_07035 [Actinobacteria bacterium RBG_16_67_15]|nr:MAG: hypothetical protein A2135_07035 [Actinobacteria bacterium RBG_16_67_15]
MSCQRAASRVWRSVAIDVLQANWVPGAPTLYIGSGDDLRARVGLLLEFSHAGRDKSVFHWGGRLLWQLRDSGDLRISWRVEAKHRALEKALVEDFKSMYGVLPFANLRMPSGR